MSRLIPYYIYILLAALFPTPCAAQKSAPKHEVRAVWVTTLSNLDWPRTRATNAEGRRKQQQELCELLDQLKRANINTVMLQTRVRGTVIYPSAIEPWDNSLTGSYDKSPGYDPLRFAIDECHKRGMELHAWVVTIPCFKTEVAKRLGKKSVLKTNPKLCLRHDGMWYLDPGQPGTADYLTRLCTEIVKNYDVDGLHFDYIRYPERAPRFPDNASWKKYGKKGESKAAWRRNNITRCVRQIHTAVKRLKPWVKVSSSPIGKYADLTRFPSRGWNARDAVHQDAQAWLRMGIHDMLLPMMYFQGDHFYPFAADWQENSLGRPVVPGLGIYFLHEGQKDWPLDVIEREMQVVRSLGLGQAYFRSRFLTDDVKGIYTYLCEDFYPHLALTPPMRWQDSIPPSAPAAKLSVPDATTGLQTLHWTAATDNASGRDIYYNVYASRQWPVDVSQAENLVATRLVDSSFTINPVHTELNHLHFAVTAMDRFGNESCATQLSNPSPQVFASERGLPHDGYTLHLEPPYKEYVIITDAAGHILRSAPHRATLDISHLPAGVYMVRTLEKKGVSRRIGFFFK